MKRLAIAFVAQGSIPFNVIFTTLKVFPTSYIYLLNQNHEVLEDIHKNILHRSAELG